MGWSLRRRSQHEPKCRLLLYVSVWRLSRDWRHRCCYKVKKDKESDPTNEALDQMRISRTCTNNLLTRSDCTDHSADAKKAE